MNEYDYDNLPNKLEVKPVPESMTADVVGVIKAALDGDLAKAEDAKVAYVYRRKNEMSMDAVGGPRNDSYGKSDDDIVLQVTIRIGGESYVRNELPALVALEGDLKAQHEAAEQAKLEKELAEAEQAEAAAKAAAKKASERLAELKARRKG